MKVRALVVSLLVAAGARAAAAQPRACVPGAQVECSCMGGVKSVQVCAGDGASFLPCQCAAAPAASPPPVGAPPPAGPGPLPAPPAAPPPAGAGSLEVSTDAPATISVDGGEV